MEIIKQIRVNGISYEVYDEVARTTNAGKKYEYTDAEGNILTGGEIFGDYENNTAPGEFSAAFGAEKDASGDYLVDVEGKEIIPTAKENIDLSVEPNGNAWRYNEAVGTGSLAAGMGAVAYSRASKSLGYRTQTGYPPRFEELNKRTHYERQTWVYTKAGAQAKENVKEGQEAIYNDSDKTDKYIEQIWVVISKKDFEDEEIAGPKRVIIEPEFLKQKVTFSAEDIDTSVDIEGNSVTVDSSNNQISCYVKKSKTGVSIKYKLPYSVPYFSLSLTSGEASSSLSGNEGKYATFYLCVKANDTELVPKETFSSAEKSYTSDFTLSETIDTIELYFTNAFSQSSFIVKDISIMIPDYPADNKGQAAVAIGQDTKAVENASFASGGGTKALAINSTAMGTGTIASGTNGSMAINRNTIASGTSSFAAGRSTEAAGTNQTTIGKFNIVDKDNKYAFIVGNGTNESARANALTIDWSGNAKFSGKVYSGSKQLATVDLATQSSNGLFSSADKAKLDGLSSNVATQTANGLMSSADKKTLDNLASTSITKGSGLSSTQQGYSTIASGDYSSAEGASTVASGALSHAQGISSKATGKASFATGSGTTASGEGSTALGGGSIASGEFSVASGYHSESAGIHSFAAGHQTKASGSHAFTTGYGTEAQAKFSSVFGYNTHTAEVATNATDNPDSGDNTGIAQMVIGTHNAYQNNAIDDALFVVGNGHHTPNPVYSNAFIVKRDGNIQAAGEYGSMGADYAEMFEWEDGNPEAEDRIGYVVALEGEKIRLAQSNDNILGVVSGTAAVLGDSAAINWKDKYVTDDFGRIIYDMVEEFEEIENENGEKIQISLGFFKCPRLNPEYDETKGYIPREQRPEWSKIGMLGKLYVRDDGTCLAGQYAKVSENGILTYSLAPTNIQVMKRTKENIVYVLMK